MNRTNFIFWNLKKQPIENLVAVLARDSDAHVLMLAECNSSPGDVLVHLNAPKLPRFTFHSPVESPVQLYSRFPRRSVRGYRDLIHAGMWKISPPIGEEIALVVAHFPSKRNRSAAAQALYCTRFITAIEAGEKNYGHCRTIVCGDFNMNPFEIGMVSTTGLHAVMTREIANRKSRIVDKQPRNYFYNPMWGLFGDNSNGPPGTYYHASGDETSTYWHMFDQVLLRPSLLYGFEISDLEIVTKIGRTNLLRSNGRPNSTIASDHLPLSFSVTH